MIVTKTSLPYPKREGKVRDIYDLGDKLLLVATDRISAFDCVFEKGIPNKGKALTKISNYWFDAMKDVVDNHIIESNVEEFPEDLVFLMSKAVRVAKHLERNPKDIHNRRNKELIEAKIRRLTRYYHSRGVLPEKWKYTLNNAKLIVGE